MTTSTASPSQALSHLLADLRAVRTLADQDPRRQAWQDKKRELVRRLDQQ